MLTALTNISAIANRILLVRAVKPLSTSVAHRRVPTAGSALSNQAVATNAPVHLGFLVDAAKCGTRPAPALCAQHLKSASRGRLLALLHAIASWAISARAVR